MWCRMRLIRGEQATNNLSKMVRGNAMTKQYITDAEGHKISVILPMEEYIELMEDMEDLATVAELRNEPTIPWEQIKQELISVSLL